MNKMRMSLVAVLLLAIAACSGGGEHSQVSTQDSVDQIAPLNDPNLQLIYTPSPAGHQPIIDAIESANDSVRLVMYHLKDPNVIQALIDAHDKGRTVQVILDQSSLSDPTLEAGYQRLLDAGVDVIKSSTAFTITHEKAMVVDDQRAFITAMNMTTGYGEERDFGVITRDASIIAEWNSVFSADVKNSKDGTDHTPALTVPSLIWSPVSSESKLTSLIDSASSSIITTVENITDTGIIGALGAAAKRGVTVRLITPECVLGNPLLNYPALRKLASDGVSTRIMPYPATPTTPYMHSKMILVDNTVAYVGSINFTGNSTQHAREAGIVFTNGAATQTIGSVFETDWANAVDVPTTDPTICPANN